MEDSLMQKKINELEEKNKMLEDMVSKLTTQMENAMESINRLENNVETHGKRIPDMGGIKKWTCEYVESVIDDIHPLKDRYESTGYLPEYDGCVGYFYHKPRTTIEESRKNAQIHYNRSEVMKQPEIHLSD